MYTVPTPSIYVCTYLVHGLRRHQFSSIQLKFEINGPLVPKQSRETKLGFVVYISQSKVSL